jgi:hypothetical protein
LAEAHACAAERILPPPILPSPLGVRGPVVPTIKEYRREPPKRPPPRATRSKGDGSQRELLGLVDAQGLLVFCAILAMPARQAGWPFDPQTSIQEPLRALDDALLPRITP